MPTDTDIADMRSIVAGAIKLFATRRNMFQISCFDEESDWQIALSDPLTLKNNPDMKYCTSDEVVFFIQMLEKSSDPRTFLLALVGKVCPGTSFFQYSFSQWEGVSPSWRGSASANTRCNQDDIQPLVQCFLNCTELTMMDQMPQIREVKEVD